MKYIIKNGRVIDPENKIDGAMDISFSGARIEKTGREIKDKDAKVIDARGKLVVPGLIDMHVHLREPGREDKETVKTGTEAAAAGGITTVCCMPNTEPPTDDVKRVMALKDIIKRTALTNVYIIGAITKNREGRRLADMEPMRQKGVAAFSDDGNSIEDALVMREALKRAKKISVPVIAHCEDKTITADGVVNGGFAATRLGLRPMPKRAEYEIVKRDIGLAEKTASRLHVAHISCKESVALVKEAKKKGIRVTAEAAPHHFVLTDECCLTYDTRTKVNPPLRSKEDLEAIRQALADGTIEAIASDHAPHGKHEKETAFDLAEFGIIGLETSLALAVSHLVDAKIITWKRLVELMSCGPAKILGLDSKGSLAEGKDADITIIDPGKEWTYSEDTIRSKSKNSPFLNWKLKGKAVCVIVAGRIVAEG